MNAWLGARLRDARRAPRVLASRVTDRLQAPTAIALSDLSERFGIGGEKQGPSLSHLRVAVVKSEVYADLFCCAGTSDPVDLTFSSRMRSGPVGLYVQTSCTGLIVRHESAWSDEIVRERVRDCNHRNLEHFLEEIPKSVARDSAYSALGTQHDFAVSAMSVDWGQFDLVLALDACVPAVITRQSPETQWAYCIGEPCMREYGRSSRRAIPGYAWFFNQHFRSVETSTLSPHEIEWPYYLQYPGCFASLFDPEAVSERSGFVLEHHSAAVALNSTMRALESYGPVRLSAGTPREILQRLHRGKYFLRLGGRRLWGNALIEAVSSGCLVLGDRRAFVHSDIFRPATTAESQAGILERVRALEDDDDLFAAELRWQRSVIRFLCFERPISDLLAKTGLQ